MMGGRGSSPVAVSPGQQRKTSVGDDVLSTSAGSYESFTKSVFLPSGATPGKRALKGPQKTYLVGVTGGTASGKTTLSKLIVGQLKKRSILLLSLDSFYRPLTEDEKLALMGEEGFNFDLPSSFDYDLLLKTMRKLVIDREPVQVPVYDFVSSDRVGSETVQPADVVILEGILVLYWKDLREMMNLKLFVDTNGETRLARRILRDTRERGRNVEAVLLQYERFVRPAFERFISQTKDYADIIVPRGSANKVAISLIVEHIKGKVTSRQNIIADDEGLIDELNDIKKTAEMK